MATTTFRRRCEHCGDIFFAPDRDASICPKCARRYGIKLTPARSEPAARPSPPRAVPIPPRRPAGPPPVPPLQSTQRATPAPAKPRPAPEPPARRQTVLTEELRQRILAEADRLPAGMRLKQKHVKLAEQLHVARKLVAQVLLERLRQAAREVRLAPQEQEAIRARYQEMVMANERPPEGRHRLLARQFGLTEAQVRCVLKPLLTSLPSPHDLTREQRFQVEKAFLTRIGAGASYTAAVQAVAEELGFHPWQVARYIDMIHEDPQRLAKVPDCTPEEVERIHSAYREYLAGEAPPEAPLHATIAERVGVTPKQVHKVLLAYRYGLRRT